MLYQGKIKGKIQLMSPITQKPTEGLPFAQQDSPTSPCRSPKFEHGGGSGEPIEQYARETGGSFWQAKMLALVE